MVAVSLMPCGVFPRLNGNRTALGKECLGVKEQVGSIEVPTPLSPSSLSQVRPRGLTQQPLPSLTPG